MCGKEASLLTAFLVTFVATKVTGPPAAKSGSTPSQAALYSIEIASFLAMTRVPGLLLALQMTNNIFKLLRMSLRMINGLVSPLQAGKVTDGRKLPE